MDQFYIDTHHEKVRNWIDLFGLKLYGKLGRDREKSGFHASGHIHGPGLEELVETVRPEVLIPVYRNPGLLPAIRRGMQGDVPAKGGKHSIGVAGHSSIFRTKKPQR